MTTETTPRTALHGLISCGRCGAPMRHDKATGDREALYVCDREHLTKTEVKLQARATDRLVITGVLNAILAKKSVSTPQSSSASTAAAQPEAGTPTASRVASTGAPASTRQSGDAPTSEAAAAETLAPTPMASKPQCPMDPVPTTVRPSAQTTPETDRETLIALFNASDGES